MAHISYIANTILCNHVHSETCPPGKFEYAFQAIAIHTYLKNELSSSLWDKNYFGFCCCLFVSYIDTSL